MKTQWMWAPPCPSCVDAMANKYSTIPRKRRRRPYGRVFRRPGGSGWLVQFLDPSGRKAPSGRTAYVTRSFETKAEGEALLREIRKEVLKGTLALPAAEPEISDMTVLEAVDGHLGALRAKGGAESTIALYGYSKKPLAAQGLGHMKVSDVKVRDVERYLAWRRTHTWQPRPGGKVEAEPAKGAVASASTIARDRELLCAAFNRLVRNGQLSKNVVSKVPKPRKKAKKRVVLSKAEVGKLIAACGKCLRLVVLALVYTGARKGEILALRWRDLCFESMTISLYRPKVSNFSRIPLHPVASSGKRSMPCPSGATRVTHGSSSSGWTPTRALACASQPARPCGGFAGAYGIRARVRTRARWCPAKEPTPH